MIEYIHIIMLKNQIMIMHQDKQQKNVDSMNNDILRKNILHFQLTQLNQIEVYLNINYLYILSQFNILITYQ
jgi:hypothetical protein